MFPHWRQTLNKFAKNLTPCNENKTSSRWTNM